MNSPFLLFSVNFEFVSICTSVTVAPSTGLFCASTTLPFIPPVCAEAGAAAAASPSTTAQIVSDRPKIRLPAIAPLRKYVDAETRKTPFDAAPQFITRVPGRARRELERKPGSSGAHALPCGSVFMLCRGRRGSDRSVRDVGDQVLE